MIKLVAFDVDGTLRDREFIPESTRKALRQLKDSGIELALCTGRSEFEMKSLREELNIDWAVTCNGTHIGYRGATVKAGAFPADIVRHWWLTAEEHGHALLLYGAAGMFANQADNPYFRRAQAEIGWLEPILLHSAAEIPEVYQCIVFCNETEQAHYIGGNQAGYYVHRWRTWAVDFNPGGMNKAVGLRKLTDHLGISPGEVAAVGDGLNDLEMLSSVGMGIAMGNAGEEVLRRARFITKPLHEDGIAYAVRKWILAEQQGGDGL